MKRILALLIFAAIPALGQNTPPAYAAYVNPGSGWAAWAATLGSQGIVSTPPSIALYCNAGSGWQPCNPGSGSPTGTAGGDLSGTYPNPTVTNSHIAGGTITNTPISGSTGAFTTVNGTGGSTALTWGAGATSTLGTQGTGGSFFVQTPSLNSSYASGLGVDGTYVSSLSTITLHAYGVDSGGPYGSQMSFKTTNAGTESEVFRLGQTGSACVVASGSCVATFDSTGKGTLNGGAQIGTSGSAIVAEYKGSATLTYTSITAPACQEQPLVITGASAGDTCSASTGATDIGITFSYAGCRVSAANTAQIKVCAGTTGTPTATTWTGWSVH